MVLNSAADGGILNRGILRDFLVVSSRPCGTFRLSNLYPGLRPGLSSAVPTGLGSRHRGSHAGSKVLIIRLFCATRLKSCPDTKQNFREPVKRSSAQAFF